MTLLELVVTISVIGAIATVMAAAVTVTFRQQAETDGNLDVARWEQALALWLPTDLASAEASTLDTDPAAPAACGSTCDGSSNALTLTIADGASTTTVSYRYGPDPAGGDGYVLVRIECSGGSCTSRTVLRDLAPPSDPSWTAGTDPVPPGIIAVSAPMSVNDPAATTVQDDTAITVSVTVNGLPDANGDARSSTVALTAGGIVTTDLDLPSFEGPSFIEARSGCGGPVTLLVDDSGSVVSEAGSFDPVRQGVESFVRAFEGTPTDLTVIRFDNSPTSLGTTGWSRAFDLAEPSEVLELVGDSTPGVGGYLGDIGSGGGTDWREALERAYLSESGTPYADLGDPAQPAPELVVFFTDGLPIAAPSYPDPMPAEYDGSANVRYPDGSYPGWWINFRAWYSANEFVEQHRSTGRLIGVGISTPFEQGIIEVKATQPGWTSYDVPAPVFLGDLVAGLSSPAAYSGTYNFELVEYDASAGWGDVSTANVLTTQDMSFLGSGLAAIALAECGGTLTVQTRDSAGDSADADVTYTMGVEEVTTTRINKAAAFDVPFDGATSKTVQLFVQDLAGTGYAAVDWNCRAGGADLVEGTDWSYITAGDPGGGINVTVTPNAAVSCTLEVA